MGKLAVISDLHADINHLKEELYFMRDYLESLNVTHLHFAGDVANKVDKALEVVYFFDQKINTTFHWGNHEMADIDKQTNFEDFNDPHFLNFQSKELSDSTVLLGVNGWYDYSFVPDAEEKEYRRKKNLYWYDRFIDRTGSDPQITEYICRRLKETLQTIPDTKKVILSTHFVPKEDFIIQHSEKYERWNQLNAFLGSKEFGAVLDEFANVEQVVFGHTHHRFTKQMLQQTMYHCRPFGYYYEWYLTRSFILKNHLADVFNPLKARTLLKHYSNAFAEYKKRYILNELQEGMVLLDY
ncbi:metallophosphoesterase [Tetragenococcus halophilus]|uniref:metallophosphoesterase n=1 Tax=Tetragenococcus halophilus TaxID=51669 RepID=UPI001F1A7B91|nr:metallophosphoesterase [Tetragenococcus halophilus]MCF1685835.1 metallophosphoesterase [Tetragenococcus halophilus]